MISGRFLASLYVGITTLTRGVFVRLADEAAPSRATSPASDADPTERGEGMSVPGNAITPRGPSETSPRMLVDTPVIPARLRLGDSARRSQGPRVVRSFEELVMSVASVTVGPSSLV
jgi:hypothetical protein